MEFLMERDKYEDLLSEILTPDLEQSRKTEILQLLRNNYNSTVKGVEEMSTLNTKIQKHNDDLVISNSILFRERGYKSEETEEKTQTDFSESVKVEDII